MHTMSRTTAPSPLPLSQLLRARVTARSAGRASALALAVGLTLASCGSGGGGSSSSGGGSQGSGFTYPPGIAGSPAGFFNDPHSSGGATAFRIEEMYWGRLVDVLDFNAATGATTLQHRDFVIGEDIFSDGVNYRLESNPVTEQVSLTILHPEGSAAYQIAFDRLEDALAPVQPKGLSSTDVPPYSLVPRNAALVLRFNDLIDHTTLNLSTMRVLTGYPPTTPFEARLLVDPNHGGLISANGAQEFRSTRAIVDFTVTQVEAASSGQALALNSIGLPASIQTNSPNVALRIPTQLNFAVGQFQLLRSAGGSAVASLNNGPYEPASPTVDIVRSMRSGGSQIQTGDTNNGFLLDLAQPRLVGAQPASILTLAADPLGGDDQFIATLQFASNICSKTPEPGDVIQQSSAFAQVTALSTSPSPEGIVVGVQLRSITSNSIAPGGVQYLSTYELGDVPSCFVSFSPPPSAFPVTGVQPEVQVLARFSEPMDPVSVAPFDTFTVNRTVEAEGVIDFIVAQMLASADSKEFRFSPVLPLTHNAGVAESYFVNIGGMTDLAGNSLAFTPPTVTFTLNGAAPAQSTGGIALRFSEPNEDGDLGNFPEIRGQYLAFPDQGLIRPRPVTRFSGIADRTQPLISVMVPIAAGVQTPIVPLGSKLMFVYRYCDFSFTSTDESNFNIDLERISWSPLNPNVVPDFYESFEISATHSVRLPDESVDNNLLPQFEESGLQQTSFNANVLTDVDNTKPVLHSKGLGYLIDPLKLFISTTGTTMMPYPYNSSPDPSTHKYYTWRDTAIRGVGGPQGAGIDLQRMVDLGLTSDPVSFIAPQNSVPTIGLPLLLEFKCYPDDSLGQNKLDISIAINSSAFPAFRAFSSGGFNTQGNAVQKNPDTEDVPDGGFNQSTVTGLPIGAATQPRDNTFHIGQLDFVYRVSRIHSIWFNTESQAPDYAAPVVEPRPDQQPLGTSFTLAYRGATNVGPPVLAETSPAENPLVNGSLLDAYGDRPGYTAIPPAGQPKSNPKRYTVPQNKNQGITFPPPSAPPVVGDQRWKHNINEIDGRQYFQFRGTFIGNPTTGQSAVLSAVGVAFRK